MEGVGREGMHGGGGGGDGCPVPGIETEMTPSVKWLSSTGSETEMTSSVNGR